MADIFDKLGGSESSDIFDRIAPQVSFEGTTPPPPKPMSELLGGAEAKIQRPGGFWQTLQEGILQGGPPSQEVAPPVAERFQSLLRAVTSPYEAISRGVAGPVSETGLVSPRSAETIGEGAAALASMIPPVRTVQAIRRLGVRPPARTVQDILPVRPGLPPPEPQLALPAPARAALEGPQVQPTRGSYPQQVDEAMKIGRGPTLEVSPEGVAQIGRPRTVVDLVDEIKQEVKDRVITDIFEELKTGAAAAMPRRQAPLQIGPGRRLTAESAATSELAQDFAPKAPAIELPPPERPKIVMGQQGYRGAEARPQTSDVGRQAMREPGSAVAESPEEIAALYRGTARGEQERPGRFFTKDRPYAEKFASQHKEGEVIEAALNQGAKIYPEPFEWQTYQNIFRKDQMFKGYDAVRVIEPTGDESLVILNPKMLQQRPPVQPTIQDLLAKAQAKADKKTATPPEAGFEPRRTVEKLGIGQRKQPVRQAELPEEPPFEIPPEPMQNPPTAAQLEQLRAQRRPKAEVEAELDKLTAEVRERMKGADPVMIGLRPAETDWMTPAQITQRDELVRELPTFGEERAAASARIAEKRAARRAAMEPPPAVQKETPQVAPATFTKQAIPEAGPAPEVAGVGTQKALDQAYDAAHKQASAESKKFSQVQQAYRKKEVGDTEYLAARKEHEKAMAAFDEAESKYIAQTNELAKQPKPPPAKEAELGLEPPPKRTPLDILKEETGALKLPRREDPMAAIRAPHEMGSVELARRSFTNRTKNILNKMGPTGKKLGEDLGDAYYAGEQRKSKLAVEIDKIFDKYPGTEDTLLQRIHGGGGKGTQAEAAAFREIKALSDIPGDEAVALKVKVKNPITGVEREFKKQRIYAPKLIDPTKVKNNPTRLVDQVMEELIADGMEPGAARTQATQIVRNMSKKSGSLQFMRTSPVFDPDIHMTNAREAYKRALGGEVERLEVLKRFGKTDKNGLLGDEIGGIRDRTANISAEAGPEAAQKAELWATRQLGMQRGEIDTVQKKAGELMRNFNTLKLGFMPVTNMAAQMPQILAAGKTTRFNPIKSFEALRQSFGKSGEGAELGKLFGVAVDNTADDIMRKFETARGGPGGKHATAFLHYTGGLKSENFVSKLAAYVGNEDAKRVIQTLLDNPTSKSAQKAVRNYNLDPAKVLKEGMTEENIFRAARTFADQVLLRGNVLDLPPAFSSESGKVFFQFKRATQVLGQMMYDAAKNDPGKLIALLAASQIGGEALLDIKAGARGTVAALLSGDPDKITSELKIRPQGVRRILDNWAAALSFGYLGDTVMDVAGGVQPKNLISGSTVAASPFESALHITQGAGKIARGEKGGGKQILGGVLREVPGGTFFRGLTRPEKSEKQKLLEDLGLTHVLKEQRGMRKELREQLGLE